MAETEFTIDRNKLEVRMSRVFNAPREKVFRAHLDRDQVINWWGPAKYKNTIDKLDPRVGGEWRFVQAGPDGEEYAFHGVYKEIVEPEKITWTFVYEGIPDADSHALTETVTFEEVDGGTRLSTVSRYNNVADLDGMTQAGMESGARESWDRLAALVE